MENEISLIVPNSSLNTKIAIKNIMVGAKYWRIPIVERRSNFAPLANNNRGPAVTIPHPKSKRVSCTSPCQKYPPEISK